MGSLYVPWLIAAAAVLGSTRGARAQEASGRPAQQPAAPTVSVKWIDPSRVAFIEHVGPYWTVGPVFVRVREYMRRHDQPGPMFMRFLQSPHVGAGGSLASQVGFFVRGDHQSQPPFKTIQRDRERVAYRVVKDRSPTPWGDHRIIHDWIRRHGYQATGPVTEIYGPIASGVGAGLHLSEVQVSFRAQQEEESVVGPKPPPTAPEPPLSTPSHVVTERRDRPTTRAPDGELKRQAADGATRPLEHETPDRKLAPAPGHLEAVRFEPVSVLIAENRFNRIAEQVIADRQVRSQTHLVWLGQVVFRIGAAARGIQQMYPGEGWVVVALADSLAHRYRIVSKNLMVDPLAQAVVCIDGHNDPHARQKRAIMRDLDKLLGRIAVRSVGPDTALDELVGILQRVQDLSRM